MMDMKDCGALVTGAGRRLGRAFAEALLHAGAKVAVHYGRSSEGANEVAAAWPERAFPLQADLSDPEQAVRLAKESFEILGEVNTLINSAAIFESVGAAEATHESWQAHLDINLTAPYLLSREFGRLFQGEEGVIVNLLDWRAERPGADHFPYTISKAALTAVTKSLAQAFAPRIRVNGLALGAILPPAGGAEGDPLDGVPAARWGTVEEAVEAMMFLLQHSGYMTGQILHVDGGRHLT